jgi:hypothetical protein
MITHLYVGGREHQVGEYLKCGRLECGLLWV